jgi:hypothetical protein
LLVKRRPSVAVRFALYRTVAAIPVANRVASDDHAKIAAGELAVVALRIAPRLKDRRAATRKFIITFQINVISIILVFPHPHFILYSAGQYFRVFEIAQLM